MNRILVLFLLAFSMFQLFFSCSRSPTNNDNRIDPDPEYPDLYFSDPAWHPAGEWIAVEHCDSIDTNSDSLDDFWFCGIWLVHAVSGERQPLLYGFRNADWNPDGDKLALNYGAHIYTIDVISLKPAIVDTGSLKQLTFEGRNFFPDWSPDGRWITYDSNLNDPKGANVIWKMRDDGSKKTDISQHGVGEWRMPEWLEDGIHIVFQKYGFGVSSAEIAVMDSSGDNHLRLTNDTNHDRYPNCSPDGNKIAFNSYPYDQGANYRSIYLIDLNGTNRKKIGPDHASYFDWSPDGSKIVFCLHNMYQQQAGNGQLWLMNSNGSGLTQLTHYNE